MRTRSILLLAALVACSTVTCKKPEEKPAAKPKPTFPPPSADAANAAVPAEWKSKLSFEVTKVEKEQVQGAVPKGWDVDDIIPGTFKKSELGFMTSFRIGENCDGKCEPKDWRGVADKNDFGQFQRDVFVIVKDEKKPNERLLVARTVETSADQERTYVAYAKWIDGESHYWFCNATLEKEIAAAVPAFEAACKSLTPLEP